MTASPKRSYELIEELLGMGDMVETMKAACKCYDDESDNGESE